MNLGVLRESHFRLLFLGQATSFLGDGIVGVALAFAVLDLTGSVADLGLVLAARLAPLVVVLLVGGVFADRLSRRAVMVSADAVRFAGQGLLATLVLSGTAQLWQIILLQAVHGAASAFFLPAVTGLVVQTVARGRLQEANALRTFAQSAGFIAGPPLAGVLVATVGAGSAIALDAATFAVSAACLAVLRVPRGEPSPTNTLLRDLAEGWGAYVSRRWLIGANALAALGNLLVLAPFFVLGPAVARSELGGATAWGLILAAYGVGALVGAAAALRLRPRRPLLVGLGMVVLWAPPLALLARGAPAWVVAAFAVLAGSQITLLNTLWETALQQLIPARFLSRVVAYDWVTAIVFQPLGYVAAGALAENGIGVAGTLWLGAGAAVALCAAVLLLPDIRRLEVTPTSSATGTEAGAPSGSDLDAGHVAPADRASTR